MTLGTFASDGHCALTLVEAGLSQILIDTLKGACIINVEKYIQLITISELVVCCMLV